MDRPNLFQSPKEFITSSEEETFRLAERLAAGFKGDEVILLTGELGTGKTVFARGIAAGIGLEDLHQVCSPSYTLINIYRAKFPLIHIDLYRLENEREVEDLGWEEYLGQGIIVVEWAEKLKFDLEAIRVSIEISNSRRVIKIACRCQE